MAKLAHGNFSVYLQPGNKLIRGGIQTNITIPMLQWKGLLKLQLPSVTRWQDDPQTEDDKCTDPLNSVSLFF